MFAGLCVVWGIPYFMIKIAVTEISPFVLVLARTSLAALVLLPLALSRGALPPVLPRWRPLLVFSAVEIAIPWFLLSDAERHLTSSLTGLLVAAVPLVGVGLALLRPDGDRLGPLGLAGLLLGLLGVAALVGLDVQGAQMGAMFEMAGVAVGYALGPVILARWFADTPGLGVTTASLTICALVYVPLAALTWPDHRPSGKVLASIVGLAVVCTSVAFLMLFELVGEIGPVRATVFTYVNPAVAVAAGVILLGEPLTPATVIGFVLVLAGSILATRRRRSPETSPPTALPQAVGSSGSTRAAGRTAASARPEPECG
jgi:drug/metabolite transporter (DMT)-like permease